MSPSTLMLALVFLVGLIVVSGFAYVLADIRYTSLNRLLYSVGSRSERLSVSAYAMSTTALVILRNTGTSGVVVREVRITGVIAVYNATSRASSVITRTDSKREVIVVPSGQVRYVEFELRPPNTSRELVYEVMSVMALVYTEHSVYVAQPLAGLEVPFIRIDQASMSGTIELPATNVSYDVYEIFFCGVVAGPGGLSRRNVIPPRFDAVRVVISRRGAAAVNTTLNFGYDYDSNARTNVSISISTSVVNGTQVSTCVFSANQSMLDPTVYIGRGLLLLSNSMVNYDIAYVLYDRSLPPRYYAPSELNRSGAAPSTVSPQRGILKVPLYTGNLSENVALVVGSHISRGSTFVETDLIALGSFLSQGAIIYNMYVGRASGNFTSIEISAYLPRMIPALIILEPISMR